MSLVGNLEDLSLGDIMQIISLSQKSGVLALQGDNGAGRVVFRSGLVHAACLKDRPDDLRGLLVGSGLVDNSTFDIFVDHAKELGLSLADTVMQESDLTSERIEGLLREFVESSILEMFSWGAGDFSFDVRSELDPGDPQLVLTTGINAQYLAMEGMRVRDERSRDETEEISDPNAETSPGDPFGDAAAMFGDEPLETEGELAGADGEPHLIALEVDDEDSAADVLVAKVLSQDDEEDVIESTPFVDVYEAESDEAGAEGMPAASDTDLVSQRPVIVIESDTVVLEWVKTAIQNYFSRVHTFQQAEQGLSRIRQYLIRGEIPIVLIATEARIDPLSGIHGLSDFVDRLKVQAPKLVVLGLTEINQEESVRSKTSFDGISFRPKGRELRERSGDIDASVARDFATSIVESLSALPESSAQSQKGDGQSDSAVIRHLRDATGKLSEASSRGEVLPVVLDFASELFSRVAILIVRDERIFAIAGRGIRALEVDPLESSAPVSLQALDHGWVREVLETGGPVQRPAKTAADRDLLACFDGIEPSVAHLSPIQSSGSIVAMLYCDQGATQAEMPNTSGLEVVLQHAGLALDRAALERALWEVDARTE